MIEVIQIAHDVVLLDVADNLDDEVVDELEVEQLVLSSSADDDAADWDSSCEASDDPYWEVGDGD